MGLGRLSERGGTRSDACRGTRSSARTGCKTAQSVLVSRQTGVRPCGKTTTTSSTCTIQLVALGLVTSKVDSFTSNQGALVAVEPIQWFHTVGMDSLRGRLSSHGGVGAEATSPTYNDRFSASRQEKVDRALIALDTTQPAYRSGRVIE